MPCCGLHEHRHRVPLRYTIIGVVAFWGIFTAATLFGILMIWTPRGRLTLRIQGNFLRKLWQETFRQPESIPARLGCRLSGRVLHLSPRLAKVIYRHPEVPLVYAPILALVVIVSSAVMIAKSL